MSKVRFVIFQLLFWICTITLCSQSVHITFKVRVLDSFSGEFLENTRIEMFEIDSTTSISACRWQVDKTISTTEDIQKVTILFKVEAPYRDSYIAKFSATNYDTKYVRILLPKRKIKEFVLKNVLLDRSESFYEHTLGEASVTTSRIAMVVKGDTIEYDARAFRLSNGSMLDDLFKRLNGVTISENGEIYLNGKYVQKLLLNGRKFFDGNPKVALRNLPAYTIDRIKFYNQDKNNAYLRDSKNMANLNDKPSLVVDIHMKKEYAHGWLANAEIGGGSQIFDKWDSKYLVRSFGMRYTNHSN